MILSFLRCKRSNFVSVRRAIIVFCIVSMLSNSGVCDELKTDDVALPADNEWRFLSFEQKHSEMTFLIHPTMMEHFQAFYKTPTPELTCASCHGKKAERAGYDLSNSNLDALKPSKVQSLYRQDAVLTPEQLFKRDDITRTMARLMGVPQYDPATGLGFSCFGCHRREDEQ